MAGKIKLTCDRVAMTATLNSTKTAEAIFGALPLEGLVETGIGYVYFGVPVTLEEEDAKETVSAGAVAYGAASSAICVFFGGQPPTEVNVIGSLNGNAMQWRSVMSGSVIKVEKA